MLALIAGLDSGWKGGSLLMSLDVEAGFSHGQGLAILLCLDAAEE